MLRRGFVLTLLLLAACGPSRSPTPVTPSPVVATAGSQPVPSPTAISPNVRLPGPPANAALPDSPAFAQLYGNVDSLPALRQAVEALFSEYSTLWLAQFPETFPREFPLPQRGWILAATYEQTLLATEEWTLYVEARQQPETWLADFRALLEEHGWTGGEGGEIVGPLGAEPGEGATWMEIWCPQGDIARNLTLLVDTRLPDHTLTVLHYQQNPFAFLSGSSPCQEDGPQSVDVSLWAPKLTAPSGASLEPGRELRGPREFIRGFRVRTSQSPTELAAAFREQLQGLGWQVSPVQTGNLFGQSAAHFTALRSVPGAETPLQLDLFLWGSPPGVSGQMYVHRALSDITVRLPVTQPGLHLQAATEDAVLWRRFLAWSQGEQAAGETRHVWIAQEPEGLPAPLPLPKGAVWLVAVREGPPRGVPKGALWRLYLRVPQPPAAARALMEEQLSQVGWEPHRPLAMDRPYGLVIPEGVSSRLFCHSTQDVTLDLRVHPGSHLEESRLHLGLMEGVGPCAVSYPADMEDLQEGPPELQIVLGQDMQLLPTGTGYWSPQGWEQFALVYVQRDLEFLVETFTRDMIRQGWRDVRWASLSEDITWAMGQKADDQGRLWQATLLVQAQTPHIFWVWLAVMQK